MRKYFSRIVPALMYIAGCGSIEMPTMSNAEQMFRHPSGACFFTGAVNDELINEIRHNRDEGFQLETVLEGRIERCVSDSSYTTISRSEIEQFCEECLTPLVEGIYQEK